MKIKIFISIAILFIISFKLVAQTEKGISMNQMWDGKSNKSNVDESRGKVFREGRYAMFIHWGLYSEIANKWKDSTYYGIGEWIMNRQMANIPVAEYKKLASRFNPVNFNAKDIVQLAKSAGMKYIIITSKHHDGFAMFNSKDDAFNIVQATPFKRDPMNELADACKAEGLGFGFYYSQNQDWTTPGGDGGPSKDSTGKTVSFDDYFYKKCLPQVEQITTAYGPIALVWFDTPGNMDKKYAQKLVDVVHKNQKLAYVSGRVGHGLGDYSTLGDMEVPKQNVSGIWESVDVTNDSWGYAWYDQNWKTAKEILKSTLSTIARGGNFMLNVGLDGSGAIPNEASQTLKGAGAWIKKYPQTVYQATPSPWKHAFAWGDASVYDKNKVSLIVYDWPNSGKLYVPALKSMPIAVNLLQSEKKVPLKYKKEQNYWVIEIPYKAPENLVSVIDLAFNKIDETAEVFAVDPQVTSIFDAQFAKADKVDRTAKSWMEKFGEWKHQMQFNNWKPNGTASWKIEVLIPGAYQVELLYSGVGRVAWKIQTSAHSVQNQQAASSIYSWHPFGWLNFDKAGKYVVNVSLLDGNASGTSLAAMKLIPVVF